MSRYVPPHRREAVASSSDDLTSTGSVAFQQEAWRALSRSITGVVNRVNKDNLQQSAVELFRENLIRGRGLFARSMMRTQQVDPDLTPVLAALTSRINKDLPTVVELLCRRLVVQWNRAYLRKDWRYVENASRYLGWLFLLNVVEVDIIYQLLLKHLTSEKRSDEDIDQAAKLFRETFKVMSLNERRSFHEQILTPFRDLLAMDDEELRLSTRSQAVLESCLKEVQEWERRKEREEAIPDYLVLFDLEMQQKHEMDLDEKYPTEDTLDRYAFDAEYDTHEEQYEAVRKAILGEDWEVELLQQAASLPTSAELDASKTLIDAEERKLRREVYLAMRSSIRADEAVHKILRQMQPQTERTICFMVIEGCCEERAYRKMYSMAAERLCKSNARFQAFFVEAFHARYESASELTLKQIEYTCKVYSHLLRTNSVYWSRCLSCLDIVENSESQRLIIQYLFKGVAEEIGMPGIMERFQKDEELRWHTQRLFPLNQGVEALKSAVNLYVAMGLPEMTAPLRAALEEERAAQKRARVDY
ncbi:MIF4G domain family protein [Leishmania donovani]|uniref:MIF4G domain family protein n=1 Tax=Leishmania donovani TaxID=5661 RepID=A0A504XLF3_LEIDO|nr:MIF4G domain family protein [Leishmania donovani]